MALTDYEISQQLYTMNTQCTIINITTSVLEVTPELQC